MHLKESVIQRQIITYLSFLEKQKHIYFFRAGSGSIKIPNPKGKDRFFKSGKVGCPDIVCCYKGRFIGLEVKTEKGRQTSNQKNAQERIEESGGSYFIVRSIEDVETILKEINKEEHLRNL